MTSWTTEVKAVTQELEDDAKELASIGPGTTFVYHYCNKLERELETLPQLNIFGLEPKDWNHRVICPLFQHPSVTRYEILSSPRNPRLRQSREALKKKEQEQQKLEAEKKKKEELEKKKLEEAEKKDENKTEQNGEAEKTEETEAKQEEKSSDVKADSADGDVDMKEVTEKEEEEEEPEKKIGHVRFWFKQGATDSQEIFISLMKQKFKVPGRSILVKSQVLPSTTMSKQELVTILDGFGAKESERSINGRRLVLKDVPADLSEETVRESIPDFEDIEFREDSEKSKCCIITLSGPDRALRVLKERRGTKAFGGAKTLRVHFMRNVNPETLAKEKSESSMEGQTEAGFSGTNRGGYRSSYGSDRKRRINDYSSGPPTDKRSSAWGNRRGGYNNAGGMGREAGSGFGGARFAAARGRGGFNSGMAGGGMYGGDVGAGMVGGAAVGYSPGVMRGGGMRAGMGMMGGGAGQGYGMGFPSVRGGGAFGANAGAFW